MKAVSWNVNGLRAVYKKGFMDIFNNSDADFFAMQEIKMQEGQLELNTPGYHQFYYYAEKKGYSGTAVFTKFEPLNVYKGIGISEHDNEGRVLTLEMDDFYFVNCYTPNSKRGLERLSYRMQWENDFRNYLNSLKDKKPVILCGDLNVAHREIDLANPESNHNNAGFTDEERDKFGELLNAGYIDSFRKFYPDKEEAYTWWSYITKARERNVGWRLDYFIISEDFENRISDSEIYSDIYGSDHCPVALTFK